MSARSGLRPVDLFSYLFYFFLLLPLLTILVTSVSKTEYVVFPPTTFTLDWYVKVLKNQEWMASFYLSLQVAVICAVLAGAAGTLSALAYVRYRFPGRDAINGVLLSPLMLPTLVIGVALLQFLDILGLHPSLVTLVIGHALIATPYAMRLTVSSLTGFDRTLERAAQNLGASQLTAFRRITLPIVRPGVIAGVVFAFVVSFEDASISTFVSSARVVTLPARIFHYVEQIYDPFITAVSAWVIVFTILLMIAIEYFIGLQKLFGATEQA